jgi:PadR family transcriptional regulator AphA
MRVHLVETNGIQYLEGDATERFLLREEDAVALVGLCGEYSTERLLLHAANLSEKFFDLKSGLAGAILQKFVNYHLKVALVLPPELVHGKFKEYIVEANRGTHFRTFQEKSKAVIWLTSN